MKRSKLVMELPLRNIQPQVCGIRTFDPGEYLPLHSIQRHVLHYVTQGAGYYLINSRRYPVSAGDLFIGLPGSVTMYAAAAESPLTYIWVSFSCTETASDFLEQGVIHAPWAQEIFAQINAARSLDTAEWTVCARLYDFLAAWSRHRPAVAETENDYINRAILRIQTGYADNLRISELAAELGLSRSYFCRIFKQHTNLSPQEYLTSCRMETAARLLVEQNLPQKEAAQRTGYADLCTFSRMFRKRYGVPPGQYIKQHRGSE